MLDYQRRTVHGASVRHAVLSHLRAGTEYSVRMQSFSAVLGDSDYSNTVVKATLCEQRRRPYCFYEQRSSCFTE